MKRRILAGLLSLVMVMSLLPGAALAAEETAEPDVGMEETVEPTVPEVPTAPEEPAEEPGVPMEELTPAEPVENEAAAAEEAEADAVLLANDGMTGSCGAEGNEDAVTWKLEQNNSDSSDPAYTLTISGNGDMADYETNGTPWDSYKNSITKIVLNEGLTRIGKSAFLQTVITDITIPETVTSIGQNAFWNCNTIKTEIPASVTELGETAFFGSFDVTVSEDNPAYCCEDNIIYNKDKTELIQASQKIQDEVTIPETVQTIGAYAFYGCTDTSGQLTIPDSVETIENAAFYGTGITSLTLGGSVQTIGKNAFAACTSLAGELVIPDSVTTIEKSAFSRKDIDNTNRISNIRFGKSVKTVGENAFLGCTSVTSLQLNEGLQEIGQYAFKDLTALTGDLSIPATVTTIGEGVFLGCTSLNGTLTIGGELTEIDGVLLDKLVGANIVDNFTAVILREGVTTIGDDAFDNCKNLAEVTIPSTVTRIGDSAFASTAISKLALPDGLLEIGTSAFASCTQLKEVVIPATVERIGYAAFAYNTGTETVVVPYTKNGIEYDTDQSGHAYVFSTYGDNSKLKTVILGNSPEKNGVQTLFANSLANVEYMILGAGVQSIGDWFLSDDSDFKGGIYPSTLPILDHDAAFTDKATKFTLATDTAMVNGSTLNMMQLEKPENGEDISSNITYSSSDTAVASVDEKGVITAVGAPGSSATISALYKGVVFAQIELSIVTQSVPVNMADRTETYDGTAKTITATGTIPTDLTLTYTYKTEDGQILQSAPVNAGTYTVEVTSENKNYELTGKTSATLTINPASIASATATVAGTYTYTGAAITPTVTVELGGKTLTENDYTVTASNNVNAGTASFTVTGKGNYESTVTGTFTIAPATLTVTADDKIMVLGGALPTWTYTVEGLKGNDPLTTEPNLSCDANGTQIGSFTITISGAAAGGNYTVTHVNGKLTVTEKADVSGQMTVTAPASLVYDGAAKAYTAACAGISQWTYTYKDAQGKTLEAAPVNAGAYTVTISGTGDASFAQKMVDFTIEKAPLTIQAEDQTIRAGKDLPEFTYTVTGLVKGEKLAKEPTLTCDTDGKTPGEYPIVPSNADAGNNYEISYKNGTLTVTKRTSGGSSADKEYSVSVDDGKHGTVTVSPKRAEKGDTVTITVKPNKGYELDELIVTDSKGREIDLREKGDNKFTFKMPGSKVAVEATFRAVEEIPEVPQLVNPFVDVNENAYYHDAVLWAVEKGITGGTSAATFSPDDACTRAQMVTFLWRAAGSPVVNYAMSFTDVPADAYYAEAVRWAVSQGITAGTSATTFDPNATVTRGQTVTFLWRAAGSPVVVGDSFADVAADAYYAPAVAWAVREGITAGVGAETFAPSADCTRGQIVTFLYRDMAK